MSKILNFTDIAFTEDGDFKLTSGMQTDISPTIGIEAIKQAIYIRLKTEVFGCKLWKEMGHDLKSMLGKRITRKNCEIIKQLLSKALTFGGVFDIIKIEVIPVEGSCIYAHCQVMLDDGIVYNFNFEYNFDNSLLSEIKFELI